MELDESPAPGAAEAERASAASEVAATTAAPWAERGALAYLAHAESAGPAGFPAPGATEVDWASAASVAAATTASQQEGRGAPKVDSEGTLDVQSRDRCRRS